MERVELGDLDKAFTRGGNRLCYIDPRNTNRCIKVLRPDRTPAIRRREKGFPKNFRSESSFNENLEEFRVWQFIDNRIGSQAYELITRCYGFVETNFGQGLVMDLVCDGDQKISKTLKQYLWEDGFTDSLKIAVDQFSKQWSDLGMPSKKLLLHNILAKQNNQNEFQIYVIDGLGWSSFLPFSKISKALAKKKAENKVLELRQTIQELLEKREVGEKFGYHGWLDGEQRQVR